MDKYIIKRPRIGNESTLDSLHSIDLPATSSVYSESPDIDLPVKKAKIKGRTFQNSWLDSFKWLEWNESVQKAFCKTCKDASVKGFFSSNSKKEEIFLTTGFNNWKKALEKFRAHENTVATKPPPAYQT